MLYQLIHLFKNVDLQVTYVKIWNKIMNGLITALGTRRMASYYVQSDGTQFIKERIKGLNALIAFHSPGRVFECDCNNNYAFERTAYFK